LRTPQGFLSAFLFSGLVAFVYYMANRGNDDVLGEVGKWIAYVLPAFLIWLAGIWVWFLFTVPTQLAHENEQAQQALEARVRGLEERLRPQLRI
jgi:hypothetical protein